MELFALSVFLGFLVELGKCQSPIMVIGGFNQDQGELSDVEIVDVSGNETFCFKPKPYPVSIHGGSGEVLDGKITVCGGFSEKLATFPNCHTYDTIADDWVELRGGSMIQNRLNPGSVLLEQGWWFSGGIDSVNNGALLDSSEILIDGEFRPGPTLPVATSGHCMVSVNDSHVFMTGGYTESGLTHNTFMFDTVSGEWSQLPDALWNKEGHICEVISSAGGPEILVAGDHSQLEAVMVFNLATLTWRRGPLMPMPIWEADSVTWGNQGQGFHMLGGRGKIDLDIDKIYWYDAASESWSELGTGLMIGRRQLVAINVTGLIECALE